MEYKYKLIIFIYTVFIIVVQAKSCYEISCVNAGGMANCINFCKKVGCSEGGWCTNGICKCFPWN